MPSFTMFFKPKTDKNGNEYWEAKTKSGKMKAQLFNASSDGIDYTMSIQLPRRTRKKVAKPMRRKSTSARMNYAASNDLAYMKGLVEGLKK